MGEYPDDAATHYNLACFKALADDRDGALTEILRAYEMEPERVREWAEKDTDLDSIRDDPRYPLEAT